MPLHLLVSPPASGKTHDCIQRLRQKLALDAVARLWALVPDQKQALAFRKRLAAEGGAFGVQVATFRELYEEIVNERVCCPPAASQVTAYRLLQAVIEELGGKGAFKHFEAIWDKAGFLAALHERIAELKLALVAPARLAQCAAEHDDPALGEIAAVYGAYQERLDGLGWVDDEDAGRLAVEVLQARGSQSCSPAMVVVDGFDGFSPSQRRVLQLMAEQACEVWVTLPGEPNFERSAHRRFKRAAALLCGCAVETLPPAPLQMDAAAVLERGLFEAEPVQLRGKQEQVLLLEARSPAEEAREALRWIKARIQRDGVRAGSCALVAPDLETYRAALQAAAAEFGMPLRFSTGQVLSRTPLISALLELLSLPAKNYPLRPLLDSMRVPFFDLAALGLEKADAGLLEVASRWGLVVEGLEQWQETLEELAKQGKEAKPAWEAPDEEFEEDETGGEEGAGARPRLPQGEKAADLWQGLCGLAERISPPEGEHSYREWAEWLAGLLEDVGFYSQNAGEAGAVSGLDRLLRELVRSEALAGERREGYGQFLGDLEGLLGTQVVAHSQLGERENQDSDENENESGAEGEVQVLRLLEARGLRFDALALLGMGEGSFPGVERGDPFISEAVRAELGMEARIGQEQAGLFYQAVTRAARFLLVTRPYLARDGEAWEASPYWNAVLEILPDAAVRVRPEDARALNDAASAEELLAWAARRQALNGTELAEASLQRYQVRWEAVRAVQDVIKMRVANDKESIYQGRLDALAGELGRQYGSQVVWSPSRLESYAACPHFFFTGTTLKLEVLETPALDFDAAQMGTILHGILENAYKNCADPGDVETVLEGLVQEARKVLEAAPREQNFRPSLLWDVQQEEMLETAAKAVTGIAENEGGGWRPAYFECHFGREGQPELELETDSGVIRLRGTIDRVDTDGEGRLRVIDYKSGSSHLGLIDLVEGRRLQLPLYAMAAQTALHLGEAVDGFYWALFSAKSGGLHLNGFDSVEGRGVQGAARLAAAHIGRMVDGMRQGHFEPQPPAGGCPAYCPAAGWCWSYKAGAAW